MLPEELISPTFDQFICAKGDADLAQLKFEMAKDNRENKFKVMLSTYHDICDLAAQGKFSPDRTMGSSSSPKKSATLGGE